MVKRTVKKNGYIMFQNAGAADFFALFLVGFTDKAGDSDAIGMFGAPVLREKREKHRVHLVDTDLRWGAFRLRNWECGLRNEWCLTTVRQ